MELHEVVRTQIQLTEDQARHVRRIAAEQGVSMAAVIREGLDLLLRSAESAVTDEERATRAMSAAGRFRSGGGDGAVEHDRHLRDAYRG